MWLASERRALASRHAPQSNARGGRGILVSATPTTFDRYCGRDGQGCGTDGPSPGAAGLQQPAQQGLPEPHQADRRGEDQARESELSEPSIIVPPYTGDVSTPASSLPPSPSFAPSVLPFLPLSLPPSSSLLPSFPQEEDRIIKRESSLLKDRIGARDVTQVTNYKR